MQLIFDLYILGICLAVFGIPYLFLRNLNGSR